MSVTPAIPASHLDLIERAGVASLTTIGAGGRPQVTAVWYLLDGSEVKISLNETRHKVKNLRANPKVSLFFIDFERPYRTLEIRADAAISPDPDRSFADRVSAHYGSDLRRLDGDGEGRLVVTLRPVRIVARG